MRTGWPRYPTQLADRIDENDNILVETRSSNYFKSNYHESYYQALKNQLLNLQIPLEWADESIEPRPFNTRPEIVYVEGLDDGDFDEEFISWDSDEDLNDNVLGNVVFNKEDITVRRRYGPQ